MKLFYLPDLGEGLPDAEIHQWHVNEGDTVKQGDALVSVETAKAIVDVPVPYNGQVLKLYGAAGEIIKTGSPLVGFDGEEEDTGTVVGHLETGGTLLEEAPIGAAQALSSAIKAMPAVRALAKKLNVDLNQVKATGAQGQITLDDVEQASHPTNILPEGMELLKGPRRMMAMAMAQSHVDVVPVTIVDDVDISNWSSDTDMTVRLLQAMITACQEESSLNAWFDGKAVARRLVADINIGIAVDAPEGLFVPVIHAAQSLTETELRNKINLFKEQIKTRTISPDDLRGSSIMLSNFGTFAGRYATPVLVPPTVAILGVGRRYDAVLPIDGQPAIRRVLPLSLTCDHRAVTGGEAARFLAAVMRELGVA
jgi:2-oxoisovalerate dehydrogenase E2 component (dihydrolipoyl transacylase)